MKAHYPVAGSLALLLILALGLLYSTRSVSAAAEGKITGTIKLDGTPAHQRPIDMSKEPNCQKAHAGHPVTTETVVTGPNNTLQYVVVVKGPTATSDNNGSYTLSNVPPGNYTLTAWQETYGTQTQKVTVSAGAPAKADFTFKAK